MKKFIASVLTVALLLSCFGMVAQAKVGDWKGTALHTDIVVYINNYAIPSYAVNGQSVIVAEDLRNFGFNVDWNQWNRSLTITRNGSTDVNPMFVGKGYTTGAKFTDILETDISVWAGGRRLTSYAMNGYTMIPVEELTMFGEVNWVQSERALKMWVDGLAMAKEKQPVSKKYYPGTYISDYGWLTESIAIFEETDWDGDMQTMYISTVDKMNEYCSYLRNQGYVYEQQIELDGIWYKCYVKSSNRTGVAIAEYEGIVDVQVGLDMDGWEK